MTKPFLILQLRPEDEASDDEFASFLKFGGLDITETHRVRMERDGLPEVNLDSYSGVMVGGGPFNVSDDEATKPPEQKSFESKLIPLIQTIVDRDLPFLGACYGLGILAKALGGKVSKGKYSEPVEALEVLLNEEARLDPLTEGIDEKFKAFGGHKESCQSVPPNAELLASSHHCPVHMIRVKHNVYGTQFHTELDSYGLELRINIYRNAGYFPPEDADMLIAAGHREKVTVPMKILGRFIEKSRAQAVETK